MIAMRKMVKRRGITEEPLNLATILNLQMMKIIK
jgi:hypothetical protein